MLEFTAVLDRISDGVAVFIADDGRTFFTKADRLPGGMTEGCVVRLGRTGEGVYTLLRILPEETVASCTYQGSYTQITDVYAAVVAWIEANGYEPAGPMFNIYHVSPHETRNPDEFVTEICYPVKKK